MSVRKSNHRVRTSIEFTTHQQSAKEGLLFVADRTFEMNVSNIRWKAWIAVSPIREQLSPHRKTNHRRHRPATGTRSVDLFIDYRMMGVGGDDS